MYPRKPFDRPPVEVMIIGGVGSVITALVIAVPGVSWLWILTYYVLVFGFWELLRRI